MGTPTTSRAATTRCAPLRAVSERLRPWAEERASAHGLSRSLTARSGAHLVVAALDVVGVPIHGQSDQLELQFGSARQSPGTRRLDQADAGVRAALEHNAVAHHDR